MNLLTRIELKGFKSIKDAALDLRPLNVLIGANGSGKSNLISFFGLLRRMVVGELQASIAIAGGANSLLYYGAKTTRQMEAVLQFGEADPLREYSFRLAHSAGDVLVFEDETIEYSSWESGLPTAEPLGVGHRETGLRDLDAKRARADRLGKVYNVVENAFWFFLSSPRVFQFHDTSAEAHVRQNCEIDQNHELMSNGRNLAAVLYKLHEQQPDCYKRIVDTVRLIAPFFADFVLAPLELNPRYIQLRWRERGREYDFGPHQLSDGTLRAMALVTLLMQPPENMPGLIIIDEPELGLHPYAIAILASLLKTASHHTQIIVATESPVLLNHFAPDDIVVTERRMGETTFRRCQESELKEWLAEYSLGQLWEKNVLGGGPSR